MPKQINQDRIGEVKKIYPGHFNPDTPEFKLCCSHCFNYPCGAPDFCEKAKAHVKNCQLFTQPLDDKELREKIVDILNCEADQCSDYCSGSDGCIGCQADQILALLQPKIEEAEKRGADSGVKAYESTCESLIVEAKKQGIRAAIDDLKMHYCIIDTEAKIKEIEEQALSGKGAGK